MTASVEIRSATAADAPALAELYRGTIRNVNKAHYTQEQVDAWSGRSYRTESLIRRIGEQHFLVATQGEDIVGFASITKDGSYIDFMYVHKDRQRQGIAALLYNTLENFALDQEAEEIQSDVSITARPFFERHGFVVLQQQSVDLDGVFLTNFKMRKTLRSFSGLSCPERPRPVP